MILQPFYADMFRHNKATFREYAANLNPIKINFINLFQAWCVLPKDGIVTWIIEAMNSYETLVATSHEDVGSMSLRNIGNCLHNVVTQKTSLRLIWALSSRPIRDVTNETHSWAFQTNLYMSLI